jgi:hypothetical protein
MSLKCGRYGASKRNGLTPGGKTNRSMSNLATKTINKAANSGQKLEKNHRYTDSGQNFRDANNKSIKGTTVDEGRLSRVINMSPRRSHVLAFEGALPNQTRTERLYLDDKPLKFGSMKRTVKPLKKINK